MLFRGALCAMLTTGLIIEVKCKFLGGNCNVLCRALAAFSILFCSLDPCG